MRYRMWKPLTAYKVLLQCSWLVKTTPNYQISPITIFLSPSSNSMSLITTWEILEITGLEDPWDFIYSNPCPQATRAKGPHRLDSESHQMSTHFLLSWSRYWSKKHIKKNTKTDRLCHVEKTREISIRPILNFWEGNSTICLGNPF